MSQTPLKKFMLIFLLWFCFGVTAFAEELEDQVFDRVRQQPESLLLEMYQAAQITALGESNHSNYRIYEYLLSLLRSVGTDPHLKYIALERFFDAESFFADASVMPLEKAIQRNLPTFNDRFSVLCGADFSAGPYFIYEVLSLIRELNQLRPSNNPLIVVPIDGAGHTYPTMPPIDRIQDGNCHSPATVANYGASWDRENRTRSIFEEKIISKLGTEDKVIVVYHMMHLIQGWEACMPQIAASGDHWETNWFALDWLSFFLQDNPLMRKKTRIVLFDERDAIMAPDGFFRFSRRQEQRYPGTSFGVPLAPFFVESSQRGIELIQPTTLLRSKWTNPVRSNSLLSQMGDALIWSWDAEINSPAVGLGRHYFPNDCPY